MVIGAILRKVGHRAYCAPNRWAAQLVLSGPQACVKLAFRTIESEYAVRQGRKPQCKPRAWLGSILGMARLENWAVVVRRIAEVATRGGVILLSCVMPKIVEPNLPTVECAVCGQQMKHLANLKSTAAFEASRVYRCYSCDHVLQREW